MSIGAKWEAIFILLYSTPLLRPLNEPVVVCAVHPCGQLVSLDASCIGYVLQKSAEEEVEESCIGAQRDH